MACWERRAWSVGGGGAEKIAWGGQGKWRWLPSVVYEIEIRVPANGLRGAMLWVVRRLAAQCSVNAHLSVYPTKYFLSIDLQVCWSLCWGPSHDGTIEIPPSWPYMPLSGIASGRLDWSRDMSDTTRTEGYLREGLRDISGKEIRSRGNFRCKNWIMVEQKKGQKRLGEFLQVEKGCGGDRARGPCRPGPGGLYLRAIECFCRVLSRCFVTW